MRDVAKYNQFRGLQRKMFFIDQSGGECISCGYNKNISALHFHHKDSKKKKFTLNHRNLAGKKMKDLHVEHNKCALLCANCHSEHHNPTNETKQVKRKIKKHEENRS